jgi:beta-phosphoglucomutase
MIKTVRAAIFDLDGVIVDTAKYHYLAWKRLANENGFDFTEADNERLKGVSRMRSLEILLEIGGLNPSAEGKERMAERKNAWYVEYLQEMDASELLPGSVDYLRHLRMHGVKTALGSASKNARLILDRLYITSLFDVIIDGTKVQRAKPDPEVFLLAAHELDIQPEYCVVFEDAEAGIEAARRAGMSCVGVGNPVILKDADMVIAGLYQLVALTIFPDFLVRQDKPLA